jgi:hypothetical protein
VIFDRLLDLLRQRGLVAAGGRQRTDSTHVLARIRDLNRLELAGRRYGRRWRRWPPPRRAGWPP